MDERRVAANRSAFAKLPLSVVLKIDQIADDFESEWLSGNNPDIGGYVQKVSAAGEAVCAALESHLRELQSDLESSNASRDKTPAGTASATWTSDSATALPVELPSSGEPISVGEYRLLSQLGAGGMGVVYKALHTRLDCLVAIKFPRFDETLNQQAAVRFLREARLIGRLKHGHIVRALDAGDSRYGPYLVTDFIEGETVEELVRREGPVPFEKCLSLAAQAAQGLAYAHSQGVVHRDIKPSNMLIDERGVLRVVDFGLAKMHVHKVLADDQEQLSDQTVRGTFLGTVGYAAPEQLWTDEPIDQRADIYALGCVVFFMLTGEAPHKGSLSERLLSHQGDSGSDVREPSCVTSPGFSKAWRRMVAKAPNQRYQSMSEVESALQTELTEWREGRRSSDPSRRIAFALPAIVVLLGLVLWGLSQFGRDALPAKQAQTGPAPHRAIAPFGAKQGQEIQQQWADYLDVPVRVNNSIGMRLVLIPAGEFEMGLSDISLPESLPPPDDWRYLDPELLIQEQTPRHRVVLTKAYYFGETEVTTGQFRQFVEASEYVTDAERTKGWGKEDGGWLLRSGYSWKNMGQWLSDEQHPVINVTWNDAVAFCRWLSESDELGDYRLPTEAEWEFACRAGSTTRYYFGESPDELPAHAWFKGNFQRVFQPVGLKKPNPFGLYDIYGNRQEWCQDIFATDFYNRSPLSDPVCRSGGDKRVMRGGAHTDLASFCTSARRWSQADDNPGAAGIRVVCIPK